MQDDSGSADAAVDWPAVKATYEAGKVPVRLILAEHRITSWQLKKRYLAEGWTLRPQPARPALGSIPRGPIEAVFDTIVRLIEMQVERLAGLPDAVPERDMLALAELVRSAERLMEADLRRRQLAGRAARRSNAPKPALDGGRNKEEEARAADVEWMRAELKRRIATFRQRSGLE